MAPLVSRGYPRWIRKNNLTPIHHGSSAAALWSAINQSNPSLQPSLSSESTPTPCRELVLTGVEPAGDEDSFSENPLGEAGGSERFGKHSLISVRFCAENLGLLLES